MHVLQRLNIVRDNNTDFNVVKFINLLSTSNSKIISFFQESKSHLWWKRKNMYLFILPALISVYTEAGKRRLKGNEQTYWLMKIIMNMCIMC